jgi:SNF2 family DNA or RNA helicase
MAQGAKLTSKNSPVKIAMSGTPVENRLMEYWSILDFANSGYLGNTNWFNEK